MNLIETASLTDRDKRQIFHIWNQEYPVVIQHGSLESFQEYLSKLEKAHHLILESEGQNLGWFADFAREGERWFAMILDSSVQGKGWGSKLLNLAKTRNDVLNGWVVGSSDLLKQNGQQYISPLPFYIKNGFTVHPETKWQTEVLTTIKVQWRKVD
jgi:GNAT superfamily N-acetyltransferase